MNPYRLPRLLVLIPAVVCPIGVLALVIGTRAEIAGLQLSDHPVLFVLAVLGAFTAIPLYRWLYRKEDRWELADLPGWEEEVEAQLSQEPASPPVDFWARFWSAFFAVMLPRSA